ncbi:DUF5082 family protein [Lentibacillus sp. CBA3610]|uniref:YwqH-like family protein n=1 Tax=Lentibacillus sp. CBA3610 TaxID=2518176 RepID=UPI001595121E|nr:DUF5082 family protein [Lentibacillus sp. CBA3610]
MANAVFQLDSQISGVQWAINSINAELQRKQEDLVRLKKAFSQLLDCSDEFRHNKGVCLDPSLSKNTWSGSMANDFEGFKQKELQGSYQSIEERDLQTVISRVESEIEQIKQEIISLENNRSSQQSRLNDLHDQRRKELLNNE